MGITEKIKEIEAEMARTQKNKATNYHLGTLKAKLAKLKDELLGKFGCRSGRCLLLLLLIAMRIVYMPCLSYFVTPFSNYQLSHV